MVGGWSARVVVGKIHPDASHLLFLFSPKASPEVISSISLRNISWRVFCAHFKDHRAPVRVVPLVFLEAGETGVFFSSLRHTSNGSRLTGIEISGRDA